MACCGGGEPEDKEGMVTKRSCRDILCLLIFIAFWAGMFIICGIAFKNGEPNRLIYGVDSYGFTCGTENTFANKTFDLRGSKNLYWLNPLDVLAKKDIKYAKTVCSPGCPSRQNLCSKDDFPCTRPEQYICPYYRFAEQGLYGFVPNVTDTDITYYKELALVTKLPNGTEIKKLIDNLKPLGKFSNSLINQLEAGASGVYYQLQSNIPGNGPCYPILFATTEWFYRCFPEFPENLTSGLVDTTVSTLNATVGGATVKAFADHWESSTQKWGRYVGDISRGILVIVIGGLVGGIFLSLVWLLILRYLGGFMVWIAIILTNLMLLGVTLYCWAMAGYIGDTGVGKTVLDTMPISINPAEEEEDTWFWIAVGVSIAAGLVLLITLLCLTRIKIAIACIKCASQAVGAMPLIIFFPILPFIFEVGLIIYWVAVTAMLYSSGDLVANCRNPATKSSFTFEDLKDVAVKAKNISDDPLGAAYGYYNPANSTTPAYISCYVNTTADERSYYCGKDPNCFLSYDWNNELKYAFIYHFFGLLWTNQFIVGFSCVCIAGAIASYYWAGGDSAKMPTFPILAAVKNTVIYHLGSIAFGAFIIAVIQLIRFLLEYLNRKTKEIQEQNVAARWIMCCARCCLWCLEKIVKFINRNAYILIAIKGDNYCCSAIRAVALIVTNALRMAVVNLVADIMIFLGKVTVAAGAGLVAFLMTEADYYNDPTKYPDTFLYSPVLVIAISVITGFVVAEIFFAVYEMAIDTILLAFCEDCDKNGGNPKYAPPLLMEAMGQADAVAKRKAAAASKPVTA